MSVVGFDLGNENCVIAVAKQRGIDVLLNDESNRENPAMVSFGEKQRFTFSFSLRHYASQTNHLSAQETDREKKIQRSRRSERSETDPFRNFRILLRPLRLMHDCTATALGYGIYKTDLAASYSVFIDTQVCVAAFESGGGMIRVLSHGFDRNLGGRDFDEVLFNYFAVEFKERFSIDVCFELEIMRLVHFKFPTEKQHVSKLEFS
ncbi:heat shock 70 kDa protein 16 [Brassica napus]|uniref:heat shock 70 kDa protein 16 n=1 Tax=Brassica napus TaxID=3708 RepID=UPI0020786AB2|nr:heat shock 70 kDa protein 16 [Brassica napus]